MSCRKAGDWDCSTCAYVNFGKRDSCQRCGKSKLGVPGTPMAMSMGIQWDVKPGDWHCYSCGVNNYASRTNCFKCGGATKTDSAVTQSWGISLPHSAQEVWKSGDWMCSRPGCNEHNYANRTECYRCNTPRYYG